MSAQDIGVMGATPRSSGSAASPRGSNKRPSKEDGGLLSPLTSSHVRHMQRMTLTPIAILALNVLLPGVCLVSDSRSHGMMSLCISQYPVVEIECCAPSGAHVYC